MKSIYARTDWEYYDWLWESHSITEINEETGEPQIRALFTYSIKDDQELEEVISFIRLSYENQKDKGPDLDDLLGDLGISLN